MDRSVSVITDPDRNKVVRTQSKGLFGGALYSKKYLFGSQLLRIWKSSETQLLQFLAS